jgi:hypothetical protein
VSDARMCSIEACQRRHHANGYCQQHNDSWRRHGDPLAFGTWGGHRPRGERPGYEASHRRVLADRGRATEFECVDCGGPAAEWSYRGGSIDELVNPAGLAYSPNSDDYDPRCIRCHRHYDKSGEALVARWRTS